MIDPEIGRNALEFRDGLSAALSANIAAILTKDAAKIDGSYARLTCLQAIRVHLLENVATSGALGFFNEAQSDGLTALVLIMSGSSRSALKSLRSLIENVVRSVYYADHPVEYRLWELGKHRPTFKSLFEYVESHPDLASVKSNIFAPGSLQANWKKLSDAVHASAKEERMTSSVDKIVIWKTNQKSIGNWVTFQNKILRDVCLLYLILFQNKLHGAAFKPLRQSLGIAIPANLDSKILSTFNVRIVRS